MGKRREKRPAVTNEYFEFTYNYDTIIIFCSKNLLKLLLTDFKLIYMDFLIDLRQKTIREKVKENGEETERS